MKIPSEVTTDFIAINQTADSLYSLIADGNYRATSLGHDTWKTLLGSHSVLQPKCNMEGFNTAVSPGPHYARIGIFGNNEDDCNTCDSFMGFGVVFWGSNSWACGGRNIRAMGYILIQ